MRSPLHAGARPPQRNGRQTPVAAKLAYDLFADRYDKWRWQEFWRRNEWPHVSKLVASAPRVGTVLDVGTGTGFYLEKILTPGRAVCGVDVSGEMLRVARRRVGERAWLVQADANLIPLRSDTFDVVMLARVASHVPNLGSLVVELTRVLSEFGRLIVSDLAPEHDYLCTEFEGPESRVLVETHKHGIDNWLQAGQSAGLMMTYQHVISALNATWLPRSGFASIDRSGKRPVGFVLSFDRT